MGAILWYLENGQPAQETDLEGIRAKLKDVSGPYWLSLTAPEEEDLEWLGRNFGFHPLTLEDCRSYNPRPKLEEYPGYLFLVLHEAALSEDEVQVRDLQFYFSQGYLITVQKERSGVLDRARERDFDLSRGSDFLLYRILNQIVEDHFDILGKLDEQIEVVEEGVVSRPGRHVLHRIFQMRQALITLLRLAAPSREILHQLNTHDYPYICAEHQLYFRDVYNSLVSIHEMIETQRDLTNGALEAYMSSVSNSLNEVVKRLTLIATIFMPITFITGFWGMNIKALPLDEPVILWLTLGLIILVPLAMLAWFRARSWI